MKTFWHWFAKLAVKAAIFAKEHPADVIALVQAAKK